MNLVLICTSPSYKKKSFRANMNRNIQWLIWVAFIKNSLRLFYGKMHKKLQKWWQMVSLENVIIFKWKILLTYQLFLCAYWMIQRGSSLPLWINYCLANAIKNSYYSHYFHFLSIFFLHAAHFVNKPFFSIDVQGKKTAYVHQRKLYKHSNAFISSTEKREKTKMNIAFL